MNATPSPRSTELNTLREYLSKDKTQLITRGIEKEGLRAQQDLAISQTDHPEALGHPLTHSSITTDYSEALLELITPVKNSRSDLLESLEETHKFVLKNLQDELLWAGSMPCKLAGNDSVRIAEYGDSNIGILKHVYRKGLDVRYGRIMQSIAGLHFNFSLNDEFWRSLKDSEQSSLNLQDYKSQKYFALTRNFRRYSWLLMYLFGASPALDSSFVDGKEHNLETFDDKGTLYKLYATSLRMSDLGYNNNAQSSLNICFNTLDNFTHTLGEAVRKPYPAYETIGVKVNDEYVQLNTNILQIENEYYSPIRPKRTALSGEKPTAGLIARGVEYIEVRCLDLNPYLPLGIDEPQVAFMDAFLLYCLLEESPTLSTEDCQELERNFALVTTSGRKPNLQLSRDFDSVSMIEWGNEILDNISQVAALLDEAEEAPICLASVEREREKLLNVELCPSARVLKDMQSKQLSWLELAGQLSAEHKSALNAEPLAMDTNQGFTNTAKQSHQNAAAIKAADTLGFAEFLDNYNAS